MKISKRLIINKAEKIRLFPNPNGGSFTLQLPENILSGNISISDISGKVVYRGEVREKQTIIQLNLDKGIYYLRFSNQTKVQTIQFLVQ
ncbi:MAG: T9SS type A sorting domain-containing protein [Brumimicrobium sp.]|nr:T9SS type A sorting domain-containing protein [Brumimicrobium sp.]